MIISKKCLNTGCHKYENNHKDNFNACGDCVYLLKSNRMGFITRLGKLGTSTIVISILIIVGLVVSATAFFNQKDDSSGSLVAEKTDIKPNTAGENKKSETVLRIHGSNTVGIKMMPILVENYLKKRGAVQIKKLEGSNPQEGKIEFKMSSQDVGTYAVEILSHGSSEAFKDLEAGKCDIGITSRRINEGEINTLKAAGLGDLSTLKSEIIIALDGVSVIVNNNNPVNRLSVEQLSDIFSGAITNWSQVGGNAGEIKVYSMDEKSGTYDTFKSFIFKDKDIKSDAVRLVNGNDIAGKISSDINAIGFTGFSYTGNAKPVAISQDGAEPMFPTAFNIATEDYYLSRRLYIYCPENTKNSYATELIDYIIDEQGQSVLKNNDLISMNIEVDEDYKLIDRSSFQKQRAYQNYSGIVSNAQGRLSLNFLFKSGSSELDNKSVKDLERLVNFLYRSKYLDYKVVLIGYSDNIGDYYSNIQLSENRALVVKDRMIDLFKALDGRVEVLGMGPEIPIATNETLEGREKNRRVEVYIVKK